MQRHFENALADDGALSDITSRLLFKPREGVKAYVYAKQAGIVAGLEETSYLLRKVKSSFHFKKKDGEKIARYSDIGFARCPKCASRSSASIAGNCRGCTTEDGAVSCTLLRSITVARSRVTMRERSEGLLTTARGNALFA